MPRYLVKIEVNSGGYEKHTVHNVGADNEKQATLMALADEAHGNSELKPDGSWEDLGGEFIYCSQGCQVITDEQAEMLNSLGIYHSFYDPEHILDMLDEDADERDIDVLLSYF